MGDRSKSETIRRGPSDLFRRKPSGVMNVPRVSRPGTKASDLWSIPDWENPSKASTTDTSAIVPSDDQEKSGPIPLPTRSWSSSPVDARKRFARSLQASTHDRVPPNKGKKVRSGGQMAENVDTKWEDVSSLSFSDDEEFPKSRPRQQRRNCIVIRLNDDKKMPEPCPH